MRINSETSLFSCMIWVDRFYLAIEHRLRCSPSLTRASINCSFMLFSLNSIVVASSWYFFSSWSTCWLIRSDSLSWWVECCCTVIALNFYSIALSRCWLWLGDSETRDMGFITVCLAFISITFYSILTYKIRLSFSLINGMIYLRDRHKHTKTNPNQPQPQSKHNILD